MVIKKGNIELLFNVLKGTDGKLSLADARIRDTFLKELIVSNDTFVADRKKIFETFCKKNEDGTPEVTNNQYTFDPESTEELSKELGTLLIEEITIENDKVIEFISLSEYKPKVGESEIIDSFVK